MTPFFFLYSLVFIQLVYGQQQQPGQCATVPAPNDAKAGDLVPAIDQLNNAKLEVSGLITVDNMCQFTAHNFTYYYAAPDSYWYGSNSTDPNALAIKACSVPVGSFNQATVRFTLLPGQDFSQFAVLKLYSEAYRLVIANVKVRPGAVVADRPASKSSSARQSGWGVCMLLILIAAGISMW
ncbi:uncharacterized protein VTP21DRAFT_11541 [Calcarisporiella thermophila]|uniref:uncharacterized protein n=1 Tax=Calcarisporiella thermophila TaxID=911321 RepID=UPI003742EAFF